MLGTVRCVARLLGNPAIAKVAGTQPNEDREMLYWALVFFIIAIIAGAFGFGGISAAAAGIAQLLFYIFVVIFLVALIAGLLGGRRAGPPL
jgi:uncharacterized membrane protein YtjA (UPF0391 family)